MVIGASLGPPAGVALVVLGLMFLGIFGCLWNVGLTTLFTRDTDSSMLGRVSVNLRTLTALAAMVGAMSGGMDCEPFRCSCRVVDFCCCRPGGHVAYVFQHLA
jgi:hypothetical protein